MDLIDLSRSVVTVYGIGIKFYRHRGKGRQNRHFFHAVLKCYRHRVNGVSHIAAINLFALKAITDRK